MTYVGRYPPAPALDPIRRPASGRSSHRRWRPPPTLDGPEAGEPGPVIRSVRRMAENGQFRTLSLAAVE